MHEMSIAASMLEAVQAESARRGAHVLAVGVKIGALSGVGSESLRFCFDALVRDTHLAPPAPDARGIFRSKTTIPNARGVARPRPRWRAATSWNSLIWRSKKHDPRAH